MSRQMLTRMEAHRLYDWIQGNQEAVKALTYAELAVRISNEIGFVVNDRHVENACNDFGYTKQKCVRNNVSRKHMSDIYNKTISFTLNKLIQFEVTLNSENKNEMWIAEARNLLQELQKESSQ